MRRLQQMVRSVGLVIACFGVTLSISFGQHATPAQKVEIPANATALEGVPKVRIDSAERGTKRRVLDAAEAAKDRLTINVTDGQLFWASRGNRPLRLNTSGDFTYLSSDPGKYIRLTRVNDRIEYVEHVDTASESVTWWGELRIVIGR